MNKIMRPQMVLVFLFLLMLSSSAMSEEAHEGKAPTFSIESLSYQMNGSEEMSVRPGDSLVFSEGGMLTLKKLTFVTDAPEASLRCWVEAYLHDGMIGGEGGVDYQNARTASQLHTVSPGKYSLVFDGRPWTLDERYDRFTLTLVHQYGRAGQDFQIVDGAFINLHYD